MEYENRIRSQKVTSVYPNIDRALFEIEAIPSVLRAEGKVDLHDNSRELAYRTGMAKRFSPTTLASASDICGWRVRGEN